MVRIRHLRTRARWQPLLLLLAVAAGLFTTASPAAAAREYPPSVVVPLQVTATTDYGDTVLLSGSSPELGSWDPAKAVPLTTGPGTYPVWSANVSLPPGPEVQYKYIRRTAAGSLVWETVPNRSVFISPTGETALRDRWNVAGGSPVTAVFQVTAHTSYGQNVYVTGDLAELGAWNPARAVPLTTGTGTYPVWSGGVQLPPNTAVRYKYFTKNADGTVTWEGGADRTATTVPSGVLTVNDTLR
ncbi:hypothetical protein LO771_10865 [Streptacidiphilus sp. ASG 303]|uniref:carbohydrate-binding module family 20 domain-containing protein n=1 Tax=Streptacidiphilus sp. ASG 303 TaxID=2896847 RepID=UPI001E2FD802|nr:carbohydrate-binding module family 20 domain-containing protein [Streptacidiphilus sp. ASG 303]MCD0482887.1 hypothetical protein [Streptacidiphilus sp. ASG 303]